VTRLLQKARRVLCGLSFVAISARFTFLENEVVL
jgi:hypothetical protein